MQPVTVESFTRLIAVTCARNVVNKQKLRKKEVNKYTQHQNNTSDCSRSLVGAK